VEGSAVQRIKRDGRHCHCPRELRQSIQLVTHMARMTESTRVTLMTIHGLAMVGLGLVLFYIRATMTNSFFYIFGTALAMLLVAASLLFIALLEWIYATGLGNREVRRFRGLLFISTVAAAGSILLIFHSGLMVNLLCYLIATYALLLGYAKFGLARAWNGNPRQRAVIYLFAIIAFVFSGLLVMVAGSDNRISLAVIAGYSCFMGLQMLLTMNFLLRQLHRPSAQPKLLARPVAVGNSDRQRSAG
jgi:hypothetical protein